MTVALEDDGGDIGDVDALGPGHGPEVLSG